MDFTSFARSNQTSFPPLRRDSRSSAALATPLPPPPPPLPFNTNHTSGIRSLSTTSEACGLQNHRSSRHHSSNSSPIFVPSYLRNSRHFERIYESQRNGRSNSLRVPPTQLPGISRGINCRSVPNTTVGDGGSAPNDTTFSNSLSTLCTPDGPGFSSSQWTDTDQEMDSNANGNGSLTSYATTEGHFSGTISQLVSRVNSSFTRVDEPTGNSPVPWGRSGRISSRALASGTRLNPSRPNFMTASNSNFSSSSPHRSGKRGSWETRFNNKAWPEVNVLPSRWNEWDKFPGVEIMSPDGLEVCFTGLGKTADEAAAIRANHPMPRQCGIYYYEVTVMHKGKEGTVAVGFAGPKVSLSRLPGWEPDSWAYHGDDGNTFYCTHSGKEYGPKYTTLDVIGCGVNFRTNSAFFTKNGVHLGTAFEDIKSKVLYPCVGMKKRGEKLRANFGQAAFVFDIDEYVVAEKRIVQKEIDDTVIEKLRPSVKGNTLIRQLVRQYLMHDGLVETARVFGEEIEQESKLMREFGCESPTYNGGTVNDFDSSDIRDAINRQKIQNAILRGDIDMAMKYTREYYPSVLDQNPEIYFKLRCRKFVEMIRCSAYLNKRGKQQESDVTNSNHDLDCDDEEVARGRNKERESIGHVNSNKIDEDGSDTFSDITDILRCFLPNKWVNGTESKYISDGRMMSTIEEQQQEILSKLLTYGKELMKEFQDTNNTEMRGKLEETLALIAYPEPQNSPLAKLMDIAQRNPVAEELNGAILLSMGKSPYAALERVCRQTEALLSLLREHGNSGGAFINVHKDYLLDKNTIIYSGGSSDRGGNVLSSD